MIPRQTMLIDIYGAVTKQSQNKDEVNAFLRYLKSYRGPDDPRPERVPPGQQAGVRRRTQELPGPAWRDDDRRQAARRLARGRQEVVRPEQRGSWPRSRRAWGCRPLASVEAPRSAGGRDGSVDAARGPARGPLGRFRGDVPVGDRRAADRGADLVVDGRTAATASGRRSSLARGGGGAASCRSCMAALAAATNAVLGTVTAWVLVRDRSAASRLINCDHRPAVRAPDDRRRARADRALRVQTPLELNVGGST